MELRMQRSQDYAHSPLRSRVNDLGFTHSGQQGIWQLLPLSNSAMIKWSPGEVMFPGQVYSISWKQGEDLSSAQRAVEFISFNLPPSIRTSYCHHTSAWPLWTTESPLPPPVLDGSNYGKHFLVLSPNPLPYNFHPKILLSLSMSFLKFLYSTPSK